MEPMNRDNTFILYEFDGKPVVMFQPTTWQFYPSMPVNNQDRFAGKLASLILLYVIA